MAITSYFRLCRSKVLKFSLYLSSSHFKSRPSAKVYATFHSNIRQRTDENSRINSPPLQNSQRDAHMMQFLSIESLSHRWGEVKGGEIGSGVADDNSAELFYFSTFSPSTRLPRLVVIIIIVVCWTTNIHRKKNFRLLIFREFNLLLKVERGSSFTHSQFTVHTEQRHYIGNFCGLSADSMALRNNWECLSDSLKFSRYIFSHATPRSISEW